jgi:EAL domain-containing protein (putative c-di-GMP-specific phosphodiesterase class I)
MQDAAGIAIQPETFIAIAESIGLIEGLGEWVAREACRQHAAWQKLGLNISIAVNVSPLQFRHQGFAKVFRGILGKAGLNSKSIQVEVTESAIMENMGHAVSLLNDLKSMGIRISLDDFGTGYSSLSHLTSFPIDKLKIDQSFIRRVTSGDAASRTVTEAIIALGHSLKLDVVAEGVESQQALDYLSAQGCDQAQGYWISQPLPANELVRWCIERRAL